MKNSIKLSLLLITLITLFVSVVIYCPKGNDYIEWERTMVKTGQMKAENTQYFN